MSNAIHSDNALSTILLAPGPVQLHPEVQKILALPMIHHRTPEFDGILKRVLENLKFLFQTTQPVYMLSCTGSGGMESVLVNTLNPKDKVLVIVSGKFGERWADMAEVFGAEVHRLNIPWGEAVHPTEVQKFLDANPDTKLVLTQACETSTATSHDIQKIGEIVAKTEALFLVDGITAVGAYPLPMDEWKIDALVAGSQKGVMLPTGLCFMCFSKKAWAKVLTAKTPRYYFDVRKEAEANKKGETFFSSNIPLIRALDFILKYLQEMSYTKHLSQLKRRAHFTREITQAMGLKLFSKSPSDSVTAVILPATIDGVKFREHLELKFNLTVMGGQDQAKGKILRFGHMGYITDEQLLETIRRLCMGLIDFKYDVDQEKILQTAQKWLSDNPA